MKNKRNQLNKLFKVGILLFGISVFLWNCKKDTFYNYQEDSTLKRANGKSIIEKTTLIQLQKNKELSKIIQNVNTYLGNSSKKRTYTVAPNVIKITKDSQISFTFPVLRKFANISTFQNVVIQKQGNAYSSYLLTYTKSYSDNKPYRSVSIEVIDNASRMGTLGVGPSSGGRSVESFDSYKSRSTKVFDKRLQIDTLRIDTLNVGRQHPRVPTQVQRMPPLVAINPLCIEKSEVVLPCDGGSSGTEVWSYKHPPTITSDGSFCSGSRTGTTITINLSLCGGRRGGSGRRGGGIGGGGIGGGGGGGGGGIGGGGIGGGGGGGGIGGGGIGGGGIGGGGGYSRNPLTTTPIYTYNQRVLRNFNDYGRRHTLKYLSLNPEQGYWFNQPENTAIAFDIYRFTLRNSSENDKKFVKQAIATYMNDGEVDLDDRILNELTGKAKCVYNKLNQMSGGFKKMIQKFDGDFPVSHLKFSSVVQSNPNANAATLPPSNYIIEVQINPNKVDRPILSIARTFAHEIIHAEMWRKIMSLLDNGADLRGLTRTEWKQKLSNGDFPGIFDYYIRFGVNGFQHQQMANHYRNSISDILKEFEPGLNNEIYEALPWVGLHNTQAWNSLTQSERDNINNIINTFNNNGNKNCN